MTCICKTCQHFKGVQKKNYVDERGTVRIKREGVVCEKSNALVPEGLKTCEWYSEKPSFVQMQSNENGVRLHYGD